MTHLSAEVLEALIDDELAAAEARAARAHLDECSACRRALEAFRRDDDLLEELKQAAGPLDLPGSIPTIDGFEELVEMHRGGQGIVYRALRSDDGAPVAIKVLIGGRYASSRDRFRFEREIEVASSLAHANIVTVIDSGLTADGFLYCVMPYIDGEYLGDHAARSGLGRRQRVALFRRIVDAIGYAHRHGVVHRDLKPANFLIDDGGVPHVLDFGLAASLAERSGTKERLTITGQFLGTLAYASPEQFLVEGPPIGPASDVYSLGVCLCELLTGTNPTATSPGDDRRPSREPVDPRSVDGSLDDDLRTIVLKALAGDPGRRYASADALGRDLDLYLSGMPIEAKRDSVWYVLRKRVRRHRLPLAIGVLFVAILSGSIVAIVRERIRAGEQIRRAGLIQTVFDDVLAATRPQRMGSEARLTDVLAESARRIEETLDSAPDAQAAVQFAIGETFARSRMHDKALEHLTLALERYRVLPRARLELARCLEMIGAVQTQLGQGAAIATLEECLAIRRRALGKDHWLVGATICDLGHAWQKRREVADADRAGELYEEAIGILRRAAHVERRALATALYRLADVRAGVQADEASALFTEAIEAFAIDEAARGDESDATAIACLDRYASHLRTNGREQDGDAWLDRTVAVARRWFGSEAASELLRGQVGLHWSRGDHEAAETIGRHALAAALDSWAERRPHDATGLRDLARRLEAARPRPDTDLWISSFRRLREFEGTGAYELAAWMRTTAEVLAQLGDEAPVEALLREALTIHCRLYGDSCPIRIEALIDLAELLAGKGSMREAERQVRDALAAIERNELEGAPMRGRAEALLARCAGAGVE